MPPDASLSLPRWLAQNAQSPDLQAVARFLAEYAGSPATARTYAKECERLVLWLHLEHGKTLQTADKTDFENYLQFLKSPGPTWCAVKCSKSSEHWRPFQGPLGPKAQVAASAAVSSMMNWLVADGHCATNPLMLLRRRRKDALSASTNPLAAGLVAKADSVERFLDPQMWTAVLQALDEMDESTDAARTHKERMHFVTSLLYYLAPRVGELQTHRMNSFQEKRGQWWWAVLGKGSKWALLPVPDAMVDALFRYRKFLGLPPCPALTEETPLIASLGGKPITARHLNRLLKDLFSKAVEHLPVDARYKSQKLLAASAHWGRHTAITAMLDAGMDPRYVQKSARHSDMRTTQLYIHDDDTRWHEQAQKTNQG